MAAADAGTIVLVPKADPRATYAPNAYLLKWLEDSIEQGQLLPLAAYSLAKQKPAVESGAEKR